MAVPVGFGLAQLRTDTSPQSFLPAGDPTLQGLQQAAGSFGGDPIVVLLESAGPRQLLEGDQVARLVALEGRLSQLPDTAAVYGPGTVLNQVASAARNLVASISGRRELVQRRAEQQARADGASAQQVAAAGRAAAAEFDQRYGSLLVRALPAGLPSLRNQGFVNQVVFAENGDSRARFQFVVPEPDTVAILVRPREGLNQAGTERLVEFVRETAQQSQLRTERVLVTGTPTVAAALGQQVRQAIPLLGGLAIGLVAACYLVFPWTRRKRLRLLPLTATLGATAVTLAAFGWLDHPLSLGVITFLPVLLGIGSDVPAYLVQGARHRRAVVTALASAAGFGSLALSPLPFVRDLGLALAAGIVLAAALGLLIRWYLDHRGRPPEVEPAEPPRPVPARGTRIAILVIVAALAAGGWAALPRLDIDARPDQLAAGLPAVEDALAAEEALGTSGEVRVLVKSNDVLTPQALQWMRRAQRAIVLSYGDRVRPIVTPPSLLQFLGSSPSAEQISAGVQVLPYYLTSAVIRGDSRQAVLSFGVELQDLQDQVRLMDGIRQVLPAPPPGIDAEVVGLPVAAAKAYELVSGDRYLTNLLGIAAAGLVLAVGLSRRWDAMRAVLAALLATGWGLAGAWALGLSLSPLTVGLGSLTVAVACEFTVLLGHAHARGWARLRRTVGVAAASAAAGYLALGISELAVIREFGLLLAGTVLLALLAAYLVQRLFPSDEGTRPEIPSTPGHTREARREVQV